VEQTGTEKSGLVIVQNGKKYVEGSESVWN
jgi:hypothetical protein